MQRSIGTGLDYFLEGLFLTTLLYHGALIPMLTWCEKATAAFLEAEVAKTHDYSVAMECNYVMMDAVGVLLIIGERAAASSLLKAMGIGWDVGFEENWKLVEPMFAATRTVSKETFEMMFKLASFVSSPDDVAAADVLAWLPAPADLNESAKELFVCSGGGSTNSAALAARAYELLGKDDEAAETVRLGVTTQRKTVVIADLWCTLGRVHARRGNEAEAKAAFCAAAEAGRNGKMSVMEIIAGRELKKYVQSACDEGDRMIDEACVRLGKDRATFGSLLAK